jgi:hypothetical protein
MAKDKRPDVNPQDFSLVQAAGVPRGKTTNIINRTTSPLTGMKYAGIAGNLRAPGYWAKLAAALIG